MLNSNGTQPTGGSVRIERNSWLENMLTTVPVLMVSAEHQTGAAPGTEDWTATVEILGIARIANGHYSYRNRTGGALRLELTGNSDEIAEYGTPFNPDSEPFIRILRREQSLTQGK
jgi:hypothetical protein